MGVHLVNKAGQIFFTSHGSWLATCILAKQNGWVPLGTSSPSGWPNENWNSNDYFSEVGQSVHAIDALELSNALERAIPNLPDPDESNRNDYPIINYSIPLMQIITDFETDDIYQKNYTAFIYSKRDEGDLRQFINFCRSGELHIC